MHLDFRGISETLPGEAWRAVVAHGWPGWKQWFLARNGNQITSLREADRALQRHMPEMVPLRQKLIVAAAPDDHDTFAHFLSFWRPPKYLVSCSQAAIQDDNGPVLIRNYDLDPRLNESTVLMTAWRGKRVMGMVEGLAGLADGMNEDGLVASLTYGGRGVAGKGFGIPLIIRYVLELARDVEDGLAILRAVPCHMSYNVTLADRAGKYATVFLSPDRPAIVTQNAITTNHQLGIEWPYHGRLSRSQERADFLTSQALAGNLTAAKANALFMADPVFSTKYMQSFGTIYTAQYDIMAGKISLSWRDGSVLSWSFDQFQPQSIRIAYDESGSRQIDQSGSTPPQDNSFAGGFPEY